MMIRDSPSAATGRGWSVRSRGKCCPRGRPPPWCGCCLCCHDPGSCESGARGEEVGGETGTPPSDPRPPPWPWSLWPSSRLSWLLWSLSGMSLMSLFNIALIWCWTLQSWPRAGDWKVEAAAPHNHRQHRYSQRSHSESSPELPPLAANETRPESASANDETSTFGGQSLASSHHGSHSARKPICLIVNCHLYI